MAPAMKPVVVASHSKPGACWVFPYTKARIWCGFQPYKGRTCKDTEHKLQLWEDRQPAARGLLQHSWQLWPGCAHAATGLWAHPQDHLLEEPLTSVPQQNLLSRRAAEESRFCNSSYVISSKLVFSQLHSDEIIIQMVSQASQIFCSGCAANRLGCIKKLWKLLFCYSCHHHSSGRKWLQKQGLKCFIQPVWVLVFTLATSGLL